ncbi:MAG: hypothetical protein LBU70_08625 [Chitinispirillales bacterium]|jgi:hypothetical protein|nr:hypothetical protein [Chitinispirillales bacterium]
MVGKLKANRRGSVTAAVFLVLAATFGTAYGAFSGGSGIAADPYMIANAAALTYLSTTVNSGSEDATNGGFYSEKHYRLSADILWARNDAWDPIGTPSNSFRGRFCGNGYAISGLLVEDPDTDYVGMFGHIDGGTIENLAVTGIDVTGRDHAGGLAGAIINGAVRNSYVLGNISGNTLVGGLAGRISAGTVIENSYSTAAINGASGTAGGLVGLVDSSRIINSVALNEAIDGWNLNLGRIAGLLLNDASLSNNRAFIRMKIDGALPDIADSSVNDASGIHGANVSGTDVTTAAMWISWGWDTDIWNLLADHLPMLLGTGTGQNGGVPLYLLDKDIGFAEVSIDAVDYTGEEIAPIVTWGSGPDAEYLVKFVDFLVEIVESDGTSDGTRVGSGLLIVVGTGGYVGRTGPIPFTIQKQGREPPDIEDIVIPDPNNDKLTIPTSIPGVVVAVTENGVTISMNDPDGLFEYSMDGESWQDDPSFGNLSPNTEYSLYIRLKETDNYRASDPTIVIFKTPLLGEPNRRMSSGFGLGRNRAETYGILLEGNVVSNQAAFTVNAPGSSSANVVIYDHMGNVVFTRSGVGRDERVVWNMSAATRRGTYLIVATARDGSGKLHRYSARLGVGR